MRTRSLFVSGLFDVEHRTDGWLNLLRIDGHL
jgi:hypothetical protein